MARGGKNAKSVEEHKRQGTFQPVRHANRLEAPALDKVPPPPGYFDKRHKEKYHEVAGLLKEMGILAVTDMDILVSYVEIFITRENAYKAFLKSGDRNDWLMYRDALDRQKRLQDDIGFSPRARMSMKVEKPEGEDDDPVATLLKSINN